MTITPYHVSKILAVQMVDSQKTGASDMTLGMSSAALQIEHLFIYTVLLQLARFGSIEYRDSVTSPDRVIIDAALPPEEAIRQYHRVCQSARVQYLLLIQIHTSDSAYEIRYHLFNPEDGLYIAEDALTFPGDITSTGAVDMSALNPVVNRAVGHMLKAIFPTLPTNLALEGDGLPHLTESEEAMRCLLQAHRSTEHAEKVRLYEEALSFDPNLETAHVHLGRLYRSDGNLPKSVTCFRRSLECSSGTPRNRAIYASEGGISCAMLEKKDIAVEWWKQSVVYDPSYLNPYLNLGNAFEDSNQMDNAETYFLQALKVAPDDPRTVSSLARLYSKMGAWEKALEKYQMQLSIDSKDPWCYSDVATCYLHMGQTVQARDYLEKTAKMDPHGEAGEYASLILGGLVQAST